MAVFVKIDGVNPDIKGGPLDVGLIFGIRKGLTAWGRLLAQRAKLNAPVDTSQLAQSIFAGNAAKEESSFPGVANVIAIRVGSNLQYAPAQELGSGLHGPKSSKYEIVAGRLNLGATKSLNPKWALSFQWPGGPSPHPALTTEGEYAGFYTFFRVMHPGVRPQPYLRPAAIDTQQEGKRLLFNAIIAELRTPIPGVARRISRTYSK